MTMENQPLEDVSPIEKVNFLCHVLFFWGSYFNVTFGIARSTWKSESQSVRFRTTFGRPPRRDGFFLTTKSRETTRPDGVLALTVSWRTQRKSPGLKKKPRIFFFTLPQKGYDMRSLHVV